MILPYLLLQLSAIATACALTRRSPTHRPFAFLLLATTASSWLCVLLVTAFPEMVRPPDAALPPLTGLASTAFQVYTAAQLVWPIGLSIAAIRLFTSAQEERDGCWLPAWLAAACVLVGCPGLTGEALRLNLIGVHLLCLLVTTVAVAEHYWARRTTTAAHHCLLLSALVELGVVVAGPWRLGLWDQWSLALFGYSLLFLLLTIYQWVLLWARRVRLA